MTIDEAIEIYEKRAKSIERSYARGAWADGGHKTSLMAVAADYRQLANWLQELKEAKKFIRKLQNELLKGTSFYSTSFYEENKELMNKLTEGVEYLDD